ncbi:MAG: DNA gyrase subunit A [Negativicutes bacterium]|jgi:DNA gyrase subunit A
MSLEIESSKIINVDIYDEMKKSYIDYAMSVIVSRALPDVRDGLKPVHRRILYGMHEAGMSHNKAYKKSARIVGEVMGKFHPHGDSSIYDAIVRLAQDFSTRYMLVDGHGNFGSVDGDSAAAMRYTEVRMSKIAEAILDDIDKNTVDYGPNYDESLEEPLVLPAKVPNLLVNGSSGIAVGMATNIPPHNMGEVIDGVIQVIDNPEIDSLMLMDYIKGPDFPTGGYILGREGIRSAYTTGRGIVKMRAKAHCETSNSGKDRIIVNELPYQVNKAKVIEAIADLVREKTIDGITDLRDESDRNGMRIVIELRRDANGEVILNQLYKHTKMQDSFGIIMLALHEGRPKVMVLKEVLVYYIEHQKEVIIRRTQFDLKKARDRAHILEGLKIALDHIEQVIALIRASKTAEIAKTGLMETFSLSEKQAQAIMEMRLQRLTGLERDKIDLEYSDILELITYLQEVLADEQKVLSIIKDELLEMKRRFSDERRTVITEYSGAIDTEDLIQVEDIIITMSLRGYIKRQTVDTYRTQKRGGRGVTGMTTREEDVVVNMFSASTHQYIMFFTNRGRVYRVKGYQIPEAGRTAKGTAIVNLLAMEENERVTATIPIKEFCQGQYLFMSTRNGVVKKTELCDFSNDRKAGLIAINIDDGDDLIDVKLTNGEHNIFMGTRHGMAIQFSEADVRSTGRGTRGVRGIRLNDGDYIVAVDTAFEGATLLTIAENGYGKRTDIESYRDQTRGGKGVMNLKITPKTGEVVGMCMVKPEDQIMLVTKNGIIIRITVKGIRVISRVTQGVKLINLEEGDLLASMAHLASEPEEEAADQEQESLFES